MSDIKVKVSSDTSQFQRGVSQMERSLNGLKNITAAIGAGMAFNAAANALGKASSFAVQLAKDSSRAAMEMDAMKISLQQLVGNADKAGQLLKDIQEFGAKTPLQTKDLNEAAKTLLNFGISADKVMPVLKNLGDVSLGDSEKLQRMARVFGQVSSASRLQLEDVNQLIDAGFSPLEVIAQKTGRTVKSMQESISKGGEDVSLLAQAFELAAGKGGKLNGALERMADTPAGALSNLQDMVEQLKIAFGTGMNTGLKDFFNKAAGFGSSMMSTVTMLGQAAGGLISEISKQLPATLDELTKAIKAKGSIWAVLGEILGNTFEAALRNEKVQAAVISLGETFRTGLIPASLRPMINTLQAGFSEGGIVGKQSGNLAGAATGAGTLISLLGGGGVGLPLTGIGMTFAGINAMYKEGYTPSSGLLTALGAITTIGSLGSFGGKAAAAGAGGSAAEAAVPTYGARALALARANPITAAIVAFATGVTASGIAAGEGPGGGWKAIAKAIPFLGTGYQPTMKAGKWGGKGPGEMALEKINKEQEKYIFSDFARRVYEGKSGIAKKFTTPAYTAPPPTLTELFKPVDRYKDFQTKKLGFWSQFIPEWAMEGTNVKAPWEVDKEGMGKRLTRTLSRVGGGGDIFTGNVINLQRDANRTLNRIELNTRNFVPGWS